MCTVREQYIESKAYSENIMNEIFTVLCNSDIKNITHNLNMSEITIDNTSHTKDSIFKLLMDRADIPKLVMLLLIDIVNIDNIIYIRQKTK